MLFLYGGAKEKVMGLVYGLKNIKKPLISEYLAADTSPDASADVLAIINISFSHMLRVLKALVSNFLEVE